ncbi:RhoGEF-domain-containing protein [Neoconidiobolus thromboides FSU 785]|nr:RhoGEF-domain-containing protein [Neoconidiobolus thromboides FSU 785]
MAPTGPTSIFQLCNNIIQRLKCIPDIEEYLNIAKEQLEQDDAYNPIMGIDPVNLLWKTFRQGSPLTKMYNFLCPDNPQSIYPPSAEVTTNASKALVYRFLLNCKETLDLKEDDCFTITDLFKDDTNAFIKVLKTASLLLDRIEENKLIDTSHLNLNGNKVDASDNRGKVIREMLETERKYIQDLEKLQEYMVECQNSKVISPETIRYLFANLHSLLDFQRRFLIGVECNAILAPAEQRVGGLFQTMEEAFSVYEPFCANYGHASDLAVREAPNLMPLAHIVEPTYELPSLLIKPIQRICKYPLLLRELIRYTSEEEYPYFQELKLGMEAIERVAAKVNEMRRKEENANLTVDLKHRVVNWDQLSIEDFGELLQNDKFMVVGKDQKEREMYIFMFEEIILCCKELSSTSKKAKQLSKKVTGPPLELRGEIPMESLAKVAERTIEGEIFLRLYWRSEGMQILILKCRNEEQVRLWKPLLDQLIAKNKASSPNKNDSKGHLNSISADDNQVNKLQHAPLPAIPKSMRDELSPNNSFRNRSASSPNIHAVRSPNGNWEPTQTNGHSPRTSNGNGASHNVSMNGYIPHGNNVRPMSSLNRTASQTKVKINYLDDVFIIMVPSSIDFEELSDKVERKLRLCGGRRGNKMEDLSSGFRMRYRDEDNDFITINSDDDVQMAFESVKGITPGGSVISMSAINLYVD